MTFPILIFKFVILKFSVAVIHLYQPKNSWLIRLRIQRILNLPMNIMIKMDPKTHECLRKFKRIIAKHFSITSKKYFLFENLLFAFIYLPDLLLIIFSLLTSRIIDIIFPIIHLCYYSQSVLDTQYFRKKLRSYLVNKNFQETRE